MNKTTIVLLVLFLLLGGGAWWFTQKGTPKNTLGAEQDWYMALDDISQVHKVFFANREGETVTIERKGKEWLYNGKYKARPNAVNLVMDVILKMRLKYRPAQAAVEPAVKYMASQGIKVEAYDKAGNNLRTFYVGGGTTDERGTFMMLDGSDNPYVMHLPAWEGNIRTRFFFGDNNWRDRTIFGEKQENIQKVSVEYPNKKNQSFILERQGDTFALSRLDTPAQQEPANNSRVEAYLEGFKSLGAEGFENDNSKIESMFEEAPFCTVTLTNTKNETTSLSVYPLYERDENGKPFPDQKLERYIARSAAGDRYLIQQLVFGKIFWSYDAFRS